MSGPLWTLGEVAAATSGRLDGAAPAAPASGASIDTRTLMPGDLFFAIQGEARDGHDFVPVARERGAAACIVDEAHAPAFSGGGPLVVVPDVLAAMQACGKAARERVKGRVIAVTGSVGKTGTKEALRLVLSRQGATHASVASYNNHWGVPLTLARMPAESRFAVIEMGMNHAFEILPLSALARPHVALVTTVEPVHIEHFRGITGIADAKGEIFSGLVPGGVAILNRDNPNYERLRAHACASPAGRILTFGAHASADLHLLRVGLDAEGCDVEAELFGRRLSYRVGSPGMHQAHNSLAVLACVHAADGDIAAAARALADLRPPAGRGAREDLATRGGRFTLIDESYNANPASVRAALSVLGASVVTPPGRRIAILGDMLELGVDGPRLHGELARDVMQAGVDLLLCSGPLMSELSRAVGAQVACRHAPDAASLEPVVLDEVRPGDVVMIKGSNGSRMGRIVAALRARAAELAGAGRN